MRIAALAHSGIVVPVAGALIGAAVCTTMVWRTSTALFSGTTTNPSNSWATGSVSLSDDSSGTALFSTGTDGTLTGGQSIVKCIKVTYGGSTTTGVGVKLYGSVSGALAPYLTLTIDQGSGAAFPSCSGFSVSSAGVYSGTLSNFSSTATNYASGVGSWAPGSTGATMVYRLTIAVSSSASAQSTTATGSFTWEAQG